MFICEASSSFVQEVENSKIGEKFMVPKPTKINIKKDQNSLVLLDKKTFGSAFDKPRDITSEVIEASGAKVPVADGDLLLLHLHNKQGEASYVVGSFHGDTHGLATIPVLEAIMKSMESKYKDCQFVFGLDANCYSTNTDHTLYVKALGDYLKKHDLRSCFGQPIKADMVTTCMARTFLQPQMNKANTAATRMTGGDVNPKDHIIYRDGQKDRLKRSFLGNYLVGSAHRDNTGGRAFDSGITFPTLGFPSDHAAVYAELGLGAGGWTVARF